MKARVQIWMDREKFAALLKALEQADATLWPAYLAECGPLMDLHEALEDARLNTANQDDE